MADDPLFDDSPEPFDAQVYAGAQRLLTFSERTYEHPIDALLASILAVAVMARALDMSLESLLNGVGCAYNDIEPAKPEAMQ